MSNCHNNFSKIFLAFQSGQDEAILTIDKNTFEAHDLVSELLPQVEPQVMNEFERFRGNLRFGWRKLADPGD